MSMSPRTFPLGLLGRVGLHVLAYVAAVAVVASVLVPGLATILTPLPVGVLRLEPQPVVARTTGAYLAHHVRTIP